MPFEFVAATSCAKASVLRESIEAWRQTVKLNLDLKAQVIGAEERGGIFKAWLGKERSGMVDDSFKHLQERSIKEVAFSKAHALHEWAHGHA